MSNSEISIIVPIYNVEKYIGRCLSSIRRQTFRNFEVLLIDDGTPDNSMQIAQKFADADPRFTVYHKKNGGLSDARNYGLARAKGDFIVLIDSDDYIDRDYIRILYNECVINDADISCCRYMMHFGQHMILPVPIGKPASVLKSDDALDLLIRDNNMQSFAWNKMYKRSLFSENGIEYPVMYFEDVATTPRLMYHSRKVAISDKYLYCYVRRFGSILSTMNVQKINDYIHAYYIIRNFLENNGSYQKFSNAVQSVSCKVSLINVYSILREHVLAHNFHGAAKNLSTNFKLFRYLNSPHFKTTEGFPELPAELEQPKKKNTNI